MSSRCCFLVFSLQLILLASLARSLPFVFFHGITGACNSSNDWITKLTDWSGSQGYCVEIGDGVLDSCFMPMQMQAEMACEQVKKIPKLSEGYNIVGVSQGTMVARGLIEFCDGGPPIGNYISIGGVHAGVAKAPYCQNGLPLPYCPIVESVTQAKTIYGECAQELLAPSGYMKIPTAYDAYIEGCRFLPKLNNEYSTKNSTYKKRFSSLENLVLIKFAQDEVLIPRETSWFGYYGDGDNNATVFPAEETQLYKEDWIGLKTLNEAEKVKFVTVPGKHIQILDEELKEYVVPYLKDNQAPTHAII